MNSDLTEQYLNKVYEDLHREQMILMNSMKTASSENEKEKGITKQISQINTLMLGCLRLRNLRKQLSSNSI